MELAPAIFVPAGIQPIGNPCDAERRFARRTEEIEIEDLADDEVFFFDNPQLSLALGALSAISANGTALRLWFKEDLGFVVVTKVARTSVLEGKSVSVRVFLGGR